MFLYGLFNCKKAHIALRFVWFHGMKWRRLCDCLTQIAGCSNGPQSAIQKASHCVMNKKNLLFLIKKKAPMPLLAWKPCVFGGWCLAQCSNKHPNLLLLTSQIVVYHGYSYFVVSLLCSCQNAAFLCNDKLIYVENILQALEFLWLKTI